MENEYIPRSLEKTIEKWLNKRQIIIIYGTRQVGKTMMVKKIIEKMQSSVAYYNCDSGEIRRVLEQQDPVVFKNYFGDKKVIVLDEAQQVKNIGASLKLLYDAYPEYQIIATGSSSFDLANKVGEPLTGRSLTFCLYQFSLLELENKYNRFELQAQLEDFLIYGAYPRIILSPILDRAILLKNLADNYLYKDVLAFENIKHPDLLLNLLKLISLQIGSEVSIHELSVKAHCATKTVERYLDLLEKTFVIFRLKPFSGNLRNEIGKKNKIFFYDIGIRNAIIDRFAKLDQREDVGALWENFCIAERIKTNQRNGKNCNIYFWRNHNGKEVDYLEETSGKIDAFEFKWSKEKYSPPQEFLKAYSVSDIKLINHNNWIDFLLE